MQCASNLSANRLLAHVLNAYNAIYLLSERKPMDCLTRLGYDIEIKVRPATAAMGHLILAAATPFSQ